MMAMMLMIFVEKEENEDIDLAVDNEVMDEKEIVRIVNSKLSSQMEMKII